MPAGKYFRLRSGMCGLVVDVEGGAADAGTKLCVWDAKPEGEDDNQVFYEHHATGTVRTKLNDFCIEADESTLYVNPYQPGNPNQQWRLSGNGIENRDNPGLVFDIEASCSDAGTHVCAWEHHGGANQQFTPEFKPATFFSIRSLLNDFAVDIRGGEATPGVDLITWPYSGSDNQLWYEDSRGVLRSHMNDLAIDGSSGRLKTACYDADEHHHQWIVAGDRLQNKHNSNQVFDVVGSNADEGAELCAYDSHGGDNQQWRIEFV